VTFLRALPLVLAGMFGPCFGAAESGGPAPPAALPPAGDAVITVTGMQVNPSADLAALYPQAASIGLAIAIVPDPHVPRYRRLFDLEIQAITLGMLDDGYVLDRYAFPWNESAKGDRDDGNFGLMIFRCDAWRNKECTNGGAGGGGADDQDGEAQAARIRAIYFITDTATWGVTTSPLLCAVREIGAQLTGARPESRNCPQAPRLGPSASRRTMLLQFPGKCSTADGGRSLVMLGPTFSGAMDSVGQHVRDLLGPDVTRVCLVSGFTTVSSNDLVTQRYPDLTYARLALDDSVKLLGLARLAASFGYFKPPGSGNPAPQPLRPGEQPDKPIAFLTEASTFGYGVCNPAQLTLDENAYNWVSAFCTGARTLYFPAAIADIRYGLDQQHEHDRNQVEAAVKAALPSEHLALDVGAENGSEFPETRQSKLTAASQQLALDHVLTRLEQSDPRMVIVVATDVRDRLFLFDQLRQRLPKAMLIDLETDILLAHPDFLHASRGALTVASTNLFVGGRRLFGCESRDSDKEATEEKEAKEREAQQKPSLTGKRQWGVASWAIDGQGMLANAVSILDEVGVPAGDKRRPCIDDPDYEGQRMPVLHVVTLTGLRPVSRAFEPGWSTPAKNMRTMQQQRQIAVLLAQVMAFACCLVIVLPWLWIRRLQWGRKHASYLTPEIITKSATGASLASWSAAMYAIYYLRGDPESGNSLAYWSAAILALALGGLYWCVKRVQDSAPGAPELPRKYRRAIAATGVAACVLAAVLLFVRHFPGTEILDEQTGLARRAALDQDMLTRLALDIGQGLAFHVVTALGVVVLLFSMISLATGACVMTRNNGLLEMTPACGECGAGPRTPRCPTSAIFAMVMLIAFTAVPSLIPPFGSARVSIFGPVASTIAAVVLIITTLGASILTVVAIHASRRVRTIAAHIGSCLTPKGSENKKDEEYPGFWPANEWRPTLFAATPVAARVSPEIIEALNEGNLTNDLTVKTWKTLIAEFLGKCEGEQINNDGVHRRAVYALLGSEISLYRWFVGGAVLCALASVCAAYLFPIEADALLMWNLAVLVVHALLAGYVATAFERDGVLSNILCNRPKKMEFSASLFTYAALPFFALGFAIAVSQVPGVVDWGGGILALLTAVGL